MLPAKAAPSSRARTIVAIAVLAGFSAATLGCSEPLVFADWTIPVPEGARIVEYADATQSDRQGNRIELVEDLAIGARGNDDNYTFFRPMHVGVDSAGNMYVLDGGNSRIQMYDAAGDFVRTLGAEGSGPGEFRAGRGGFTQVRMSMAGDHVVAYDGAQSRMSVWAPDGTHLGDHALPGVRVIDFLAGLDDRSLVTETTQRSDAGSLRGVVHLSAAGEPQGDYISLPRADNFMIGTVGMTHPSGENVFAAGPDGTVYASAGIEYQVLAIGPDRTPRWALRVAHARAPLTDQQRDRIVDLLRNNFPDLDASDTNWPSHLGSISRLAVDGRGRLYVFAFEPPLSVSDEDVDVDVYAPDGERLFTGRMPQFRWSDAAGDFVYGWRTNNDTEEQEPVRYRLVVPF